LFVVFALCRPETTKYRSEKFQKFEKNST